MWISSGRSRFEQHKQGDVEVEASNEVARVEMIVEKKIYLLFNYQRKTDDCVAMRLRYNSTTRRRFCHTATD